MIIMVMSLGCFPNLFICVSYATCRFHEYYYCFYYIDHPNLGLSPNLQDYNNKLAQVRAGKSSKSKLLLAKFKSADSLNGWEILQGTYFQDVVAAKYDGGMNAKFEFTETGDAVFSGKNYWTSPQQLHMLYFFTTFFLNNLFTYVTVTWGSYKGLRSIVCFTMQDMFSQEEGTWSCQKSFCFLLGELLTGI